MTTKQILVLANSSKHGGTCVAGREIIGDIAGTYQVGAWIRPVSDHDEGALSFVERRVTTTIDPSPLDVVNVPVATRENNPLQPENWKIEPKQPWTKEASLPSADLMPLVESPHSLWVQPHKKIDRIESAFLQTMPDLQSLYLICPDSFDFEIRSKSWEGIPKKQSRGIFTYKKKFYDLSLTDRSIGQKYFPNFHEAPEGIIKPDAEFQIVLCISLTPPFKDGLHYKVVATVFEIPR